jgi:phosphinothricin acetyltransferase
VSAAFLIAPARPGDAPAIAEIYGWHVRNGVATFETEAPDTAEIEARMVRVTAQGMPWITASDPAGTLLGYAYAAPFHPRAAYRFTCENSVYLRHDRRGEGLGSALLAALLEACEAIGLRQMIALISAPETASIALHRKFGFAEAGHLRSVGFKHGQWIDTVQMQRALGQGDSTFPEDAR